MKKTILKLAIDVGRYLTLEFDGKTSNLRSFDYLTIAYHKGTKKYILYTNDWVVEALGMLKALLTKAIDNRLILHDSIVNDIGYLWNEYLQDKIEHDFVQEPLEQSTCWVGTKYLLLSTPRSLSTWLYNEGNDIYLEITPIYFWHFSDRKENEKFISYDEFIKHYKPLVTIKIKKNVAQKWLKIVSKLAEIAQKNHEKAMQEAKDRKKAAIENEQAAKK